MLGVWLLELQVWCVAKLACIVASCVLVASCLFAPRMSSHLVLQHPERLWLVVGGMVLLLAMILRSYWGSTMQLRLRVAAMTCKSLAVLLLLACLLDPVAVTESPKKGANEIVVLADNSASLGITEQDGAPTRGKALQAALSENGDATRWPAWLEQLRATFRIRLQAVDARTRTIGDAAGLDFKGTRSALAQSVMTARDRRGSSVAAVVLLSDGNASDASAWTNDLAGAPVFPVLVGESAPAHDLSLTDVTAQQSAFEDAPVQVTAKVAQQGFAGRGVVLRVLNEGGKVMIEDKHTFADKETMHVFRLRVPAVKPGVSFFRVEVAPLQAVTEATLANNERVIAVDRGTGPYRVLYIAGRPNWEYKFLRRALALDPELQLPSIVRIAKREPKFEFRGHAGETTNPLFRGFAGEQTEDAQRYDQPVLTRIGTRDKLELVDGFPKTPELLMAEYRAIIIDDLEAAFFTQEQMNLIEKFVAMRGGSLLMLGGQECFQSGGYENTPVGRMLPVYLDRLGALAAIEDAKFSLTREGWLEPWTRLRAEQAQDETRQAQMPAFWSVNASRSIKPGAIVLATVTDAQQHAYPALVTQHYGTGRCIALTIGDVWRWGMQSPEQHADMDKAWRQLLRSMVVDVPDRIEASTVLANDQIKIEARVRDAAFAPQDDASVQLTVQAPGGARPAILAAEPSLKEAGLFDADYYPRDAGGYRVTVVVKDAYGKALGEKATGFALNPLAEEMAALSPNRAWMQRLAEDAGGRLLALKDIAQLADLLAKLDTPVMDRQAHPVWHNGWWLAAVLALLVGEWLLRRKGGVA